MAQIESKFYYYYLYDDDAKPWNVKSIASLTTVFISLMDICCAVAPCRVFSNAKVPTHLESLTAYWYKSFPVAEAFFIFFLFVHTQQTTTLMFYWLNYRLKLPSRSRETFVKQTSYNNMYTECQLSEVYPCQVDKRIPDGRSHSSWWVYITPLGCRNTSLLDLTDGNVYLSIK